VEPDRPPAAPLPPLAEGGWSAPAGACCAGSAAAGCGGPDTGCGRPEPGCVGPETGCGGPETGCGGPDTGCGGPDTGFGGPAVPADLAHAGFVLVAYTLGLGALAFWIFHRRDVQGATGGG